ncbi:cysteine and tyrosine-rich protein 1-like [Saccostrea echinata]|uniref:cysteine and tyrosine-rich protein 1-like n=1 Tax=Saccostrea echinata TaxID=191078 RepID=UPI002A827FA4|nr:cysteine and tyrosine-rich protein 1-like [Saccostrea echinata]
MDVLSVIPGFVATFLFFIVSVLPVDAGYSCATYTPYYFREYCYGGQTHCCGYYYTYRYCCGYSLSGGAIAGVVIGIVIGIAVLIALIVVCCNIMNKNRGTAGRVVYPNNGTNNVTVMSSSHQSPYTGYTGGPIQPPGYSQSTYPAYTAGPGPAYPPAAPSQYPPPPPPSYTQPDTNSYPQKY